jgi:hypothetical protein
MAQPPLSCLRHAARFGVCDRVLSHELMTDRRRVICGACPIRLSLLQAPWWRDQEKAMRSMNPMLRAGVVALWAATGLAQAQVWGGSTKPIPIVWPAYYEATDLGRVAYGKPVGCLARNGAVAVTRYRWESVGGWTARAVLPGNPDFDLFYHYGRASWVSGCNSNGEYVGVSLGHGGGVIWDRDPNIAQALGSNVVGFNEPTAINSQRQVAGVSINSLGQSSAVVWTTSTTPTVTATMRHIAPGVATGINDNGVVSFTGFSGQPVNRRAALVALNGGLPFYPALPGALESWANDIDNSSRLVGGLKDAGGATQGFVWHASEGFTPLMPGRDSSGALTHAEARAIGLDRLVAGQSYTLSNGQPVRPTATVWVAAGGPRNLNREAAMKDGSALPNLTDAVAVSDDGSILCEARNSNGDRHAILLRPRVGGRWSLQLY